MRKRYKWSRKSLIFLGSHQSKIKVRFKTLFVMEVIQMSTNLHSCFKLNRVLLLTGHWVVIHSITLLSKAKILTEGIIEIRGFLLISCFKIISWKIIIKVVGTKITIQILKILIFYWHIRLNKVRKGMMVIILITITIINYKLQDLKMIKDKIKTSKH